MQNSLPKVAFPARSLEHHMSTSSSGSDSEPSQVAGCLWIRAPYSPLYQRRCHLWATSGVWPGVRTCLWKREKVFMTFTLLYLSVGKTGHRLLAFFLFNGAHFCVSRWTDKFISPQMSQWINDSIKQEIFVDLEMQKSCNNVLQVHVSEIWYSIPIISRISK